jgi:hypothetical protein
MMVQGIGHMEDMVVAVDNLVNLWIEAQIKIQYQYYTLE